MPSLCPFLVLSPAGVGLGLLGVIALLENQALEAQVLFDGANSYAFRAWNGAATTPVMTSDASGQTGNNASSDVSAVLTSASGKPAVPAVDLAGQLGWQSGAFLNGTTGTYYANGASGVAVTFTAKADKKQTGTAGAFTVVFDSTGDGILGSDDQGLALNATFSAQNNTVTITQSSLVSFSLAANAGTLAPNSPLLVTNVTPLTGHTASINGSVSGAGAAADGNNYTVSMAALLSEISINWHPNSGSPTLTTAFTSGPISSAGAVNFIDWYGPSASSVQTAALNIPEAPTWAWSLGPIGLGGYLLWRRQRRRPAHRRNAGLTWPDAPPATPTGTAGEQL